jgi:uncharacterized Fe-S cluster-containing protein
MGVDYNKCDNCNECVNEEYVNYCSNCEHSICVDCAEENKSEYDFDNEVFNNCFMCDYEKKKEEARKKKKEESKRLLKDLFNSYKAVREYVENNL